MGFLDNSGDIILDAVLTDAGRRKLARGDRSFKISKFAFGDDEINYELFDKTKTTGQEDLSILQTPILEAITDTSTAIKSFITSYTDQQLLYLPVLRLNERNSNRERHSLGAFIVAVDQDTEKNIRLGSSTTAPVANSKGIILGYSGGGSYIQVDQGLDTEAISYKKTLNSYRSEMVENGYEIIIDDRFGVIYDKSGKSTKLGKSFKDDNEKATYVVDNKNNTSNITFLDDINNTTEEVKSGSEQIIRGPRGKKLMFSIGASLRLQSNQFLFDQLGSSDTMTTYNSIGSVSSVNVKYIDSSIKVCGRSTGFCIDIPVRYVKQI